MKIASKIGRSSLSVILSISLAPSFAFADSAAPESSSSEESQLLEIVSTSEINPTDHFDLLESSVTDDLGNGWKLNYSVDETGVAITGVSASGTGELRIPDSIDGKTVYAIGKMAFSGNSALGSVILPSGITYLAPQAFQGSSVQSINIPAGVQNVPYYAFCDCKSLKSIDFQGKSMQFLGWGAFQGCTALEYIDIPLLTAYPTKAYAEKEGLENAYNSNACINMCCFQGCSSLSTIVCEGPVVQNPKSYIAGTSCLSGCASNLRLVCKCASISIPSGTGGSTYNLVSQFDYTLDFFTSETDAASATNRVASLTYDAVIKSGTEWYAQSTMYTVRTMDIINNTADTSYLYTGSTDSVAPTAPEGKVWGIAGHTLSSAYDYFSGSAQVVAVDPENLDYGWISSPSIESFYKSTLPYTARGMETSSYPTLQLATDGSVPELDKIVACAADGSALDSSAFTLKWQKGTTTKRDGYSGNMAYTTTYSECTKEDVNSAGYYKVQAFGTGDYAGTSTAEITFYLEKPCPTTTQYTGKSVSEYIGNTVYAAAGLMTDTPAYNVVLPADEWQNQLLGAGFAGAGNGLMMYDCGKDYSSKMMEGCMLTGAKKYIILGTEDQVPQSSVATDEKCLADFVAERAGENGTRYGENTTSAQELSSAAISKFKAERWGATWGDTAIVASSTQALITESAAQVAYQNASRVFFLQDDGTLATSDLETLSSSDIKNIMLIGDTSCVSSDVEASISSSTGKSVSRILEGDNTTEASIQLARNLVAAGTNSYGTIIIADATDSVNVSSAALYAARAKGILLTCRTSADAKAIEKELANIISDKGLTCTSTLGVVGSFSYLNESADTYFKSAWVSPTSTDVAVGDTIEVNGFIYSIEDADKVRLEEWPEEASVVNAPSAVTYNGVTYTVDSIPSFPDVGSDAWYYDSVIRAASAGLISGYDNGSFGPNDTLTRAQAATILWRYYDPTAANAYDSVRTATKNGTGMSDVEDGAWYTGAANWAVENGVISGKDQANGSKLFDPNGTITREQLCAIISNASSTLGRGGKASNPSKLSSMPDASSVSSWATDSVAWALTNGVISGKESGGQRYVSPDGAVTRAEMAAVTMNAISGHLLG